jgi:hypothetical protein
MYKLQLPLAGEASGVCSVGLALSVDGYVKPSVLTLDFSSDF